MQSHHQSHKTYIIDHKHPSDATSSHLFCILFSLIQKMKTKRKFSGTTRSVFYRNISAKRFVLENRWFTVRHDGTAKQWDELGHRVIWRAGRLAHSFSQLTPWTGWIPAAINCLLLQHPLLNLDLNKPILQIVNDSRQGQKPDLFMGCLWNLVLLT